MIRKEITSTVENLMTGIIGEFHGYIDAVSIDACVPGIDPMSIYTVQGVEYYPGLPGENDSADDFVAHVHRSVSASFKFLQEVLCDDALRLETGRGYGVLSLYHDTGSEDGLVQQEIALLLDLDPDNPTAGDGGLEIDFMEIDGPSNPFLERDDYGSLDLFVRLSGQGIPARHVERTWIDDTLIADTYAANEHFITVRRRLSRTSIGDMLTTIGLTCSESMTSKTVGYSPEVPAIPAGSMLH